ncbi:MAG TPA: hypothetical protein VH092_35080, partial [Urbifossiella sp.]|nr:hypothetical protein [Urbifossiella sp.]
TISSIGLGGTITALAEGRAVASTGEQILYDLRSDGVLFEFSPTGLRVLASGVQSLAQAQLETGLPVVQFVRGGAVQQSADGVSYGPPGTLASLPPAAPAVAPTPRPAANAPALAGSYRLDPGGDLWESTAAGPALMATGVTAYAQGQTAAGQHVLYTLDGGGTLSARTPGASPVIATGVRTLIQSWGGTGLPVPMFLAGGQFQECKDGVTVDTVDLGGPITALAEGRDGAGRQSFYLLRADGVLLTERADTGVSPLASAVQTMIPSVTGGGVPCVVFLANGRFQQSTDGATVSTIDLGGTVAQLAEGRDATGQQCFYLLRADGALFADNGATGVGLLATGVRTLIPSVTGSGVPCVVFLANSLFQQCTDGRTVSTIDLGGPIAALAEGRDAAGRQCFYLLRADGTLFVDKADTGVIVMASNVASIAVATDGSVYALAAGGELDQYAPESSARTVVWTRVSRIGSDSDGNVMALTTQGEIVRLTPTAGAQGGGSGTVVARASRRGGQVVVDVVDTPGTGAPPPDQVEQMIRRWRTDWNDAMIRVAWETVQDLAFLASLGASEELTASGVAIEWATDHLDDLVDGKIADAPTVDHVDGIDQPCLQLSFDPLYIRGTPSGEGVETPDELLPETGQPTGSGDDSEVGPDGGYDGGEETPYGGGESNGQGPDTGKWH